MHLVLLTQVLDRSDAVLGFFHTWCAVFADHVERLTVFAQRVGEVELPGHVDVRSLGKEDGLGRPGQLARLHKGLVGLKQPDALWVHMVPKLVIYAAPVAVPRRLPMYLWYTHKGVDRTLRLAVPMVRRVFTASEESFRLESAAPKRVVTGHGIDCEHFAPGPEERPVDVLDVGRIAPSKGQAELLEALADMDPLPVTELVGDILLARDAAYRDAVADRAAALGERVTLRGAVPYVAVADAMRRAKVLVNTSRTGSVDKVVLEAMACGTVPLTCNESFVPLLGEELAGRLTFPQGEPAVLAERLAALLALPPEERQALGLRLRRLVTDHHDVRDLVPRMVAQMGGGR